MYITNLECKLISHPKGNTFSTNKLKVFMANSKKKLLLSEYTLAANSTYKYNVTAPVPIIIPINYKLPEGYRLVYELKGTIPIGLYWDIVYFSSGGESNK